MDVKAGTARATNIGPGVLELDGASLTVGYPSFLPGAQRGKAREISSLQTAPAFRRQGKATALMAELLAQMDAEKLVALLTINPDPAEPEADAMNAAQLTDWYSRAFGFVTIQVKPVRMMARYPGAKPLDVLQTQAFAGAAEATATASSKAP